MDHKSFTLTLIESHIIKNLPYIQIENSRNVFSFSTKVRKVLINYSIICYWHSKWFNHRYWIKVWKKQVYFGRGFLFSLGIKSFYWKTKWLSACLNLSCAINNDKKGNWQYLYFKSRSTMGIMESWNIFMHSMRWNSPQPRGPYLQGEIG